MNNRVKNYKQFVNEKWNYNNNNSINNNTNFYMRRKKEIFNEFKTHISNLKQRKYTPNVINEVKDLYCNGILQHIISKQLNIPYSSIKGIIQRLRRKKEII